MEKDEHVWRVAAVLSYSVYHCWVQEGLDQGLNHQPEKSQPKRIHIFKKVEFFWRVKGGGTTFYKGGSIQENSFKPAQDK